MAQKHSSAALNASVGIQGTPGPAFNRDPLATRRMLLIGATGQNVCVFLWTNPSTNALNTAAKTPMQPCRAMWLTLPPATPPTASQYGAASRLLLLLLLHLAHPPLGIPPRGDLLEQRIYRSAVAVAVDKYHLPQPLSRETYHRAVKEETPLSHLRIVLIAVKILMR